jgi:hypothetical protein
MRLCLNSYALKSAPEEDELIALCLKKALNAAMSTIQTHYESSQTDLALSFATDVSGIGRRLRIWLGSDFPCREMRWRKVS